MEKTRNPALAEKIFNNLPGALNKDTMTVEGTVNKTLVLTLIVMIGFFVTWWLFAVAHSPFVTVLLVTGAVGGFITGLVTCFRPHWAPFTAQLYAFLEGLALGGISAFFEAQYPGIAVQAAGLTFGTLGGLLFAYKSGLVRATPGFRRGVITATLGICIYYVVDILLSLFGWSMPLVNSNSLGGILFSLFVVGVASLNLVLDFDFIERATESRLPKYMEWYGAFGLMVTLIWLYMEFIRLLVKTRSR